MLRYPTEPTFAPLYLLGFHGMKARELLEMMVLLIFRGKTSVEVGRENVEVSVDTSTQLTVHELRSLWHGGFF